MGILEVATHAPPGALSGSHNTGRLTQHQMGGQHLRNMVHLAADSGNEALTRGHAKFIEGQMYRG